MTLASQHHPRLTSGPVRGSAARSRAGSNQGRVKSVMEGGVPKVKPEDGTDPGGSGLISLTETPGSSESDYGERPAARCRACSVARGGKDSVDAVPARKPPQGWYVSTIAGRRCVPTKLMP